MQEKHSFNCLVPTVLAVTQNIQSNGLIYQLIPEIVNVEHFSVLWGRVKTA